MLALTAAEALSQALTIVTTVMGLTAIAWLPVRWALRRAQAEIAESVETRATAAINATGSPVAQAAMDQVKAVATELHAVAAVVERLTARLDAHLDAPGRHQ